MSSKNDDSKTEDVKSKYMKNELLVSVLKVDLSKAEICSNDRINEQVLLETIMSTGRQEELYCATIQMAVVGYGNKMFMNYIFEGNEKKLSTLFRECNVKNNLKLQSNIEPNELTPRRLIRIFRCHIQDYLTMNPTVCSYLFLKYTDQNPKFRTVCFPGAEHLVRKKADVEYLIKAYLNLDESLRERGMKSGIVVRIQRIMLARNVLTMKQFKNIRQMKELEELSKMQNKESVQSTNTQSPKTDTE